MPGPSESARSTGSSERSAHRSGDPQLPLPTSSSSASGPSVAREDRQRVRRIAQQIAERDLPPRRDDDRRRNPPVALVAARVELERGYQGADDERAGRGQTPPNPGHVDPVVAMWSFGRV